MRLLVILTDAYGGRGGIAQYNRDLLGAVCASDRVRQVVVLPRGEVEALPALPRKLIQLPGHMHPARYSLAAVRQLFGGERPDLILCGHLFMAPLGAALSRGLGVPLWLQVHGIDAWQSPGRVRRVAAEQSSLITSVSRVTRRRLLGWCNVDPRRVRVLPNTVEERFGMAPKSAALRQRLGLGDEPVLLTVGRLSASERYKGQDRVLAALPQLVGDHPTLRYVIAGEGDDRARLERLAAELQVTEYVRFVGFVPDADLPDLYRMARLFVMPSTGEGFGISYLEALACGTRVVAGDADASCDPLRDGLEGELVDVHNLDQLAAAISRGLRGESPLGSAGPFNRKAFTVLVDRLLQEVQPAATAAPGAAR